MKLCRFNDNRIGLVRGANVHDVTAILDELPAVRYPLPPGDPLIASLEKLRPKMEKLADQARPAPLSDVKFLSPVANPSKIIGTPVNYQKHREEADKDAQIAVYGGANRARTIEEQGLFIKASSCLVGPSQGVAVRFPDRRTDHEAELGLIIGKRARNVGEDKALQYVAGYAIALDMVVRGTEDRSFRKSIDSYGVLGPSADDVHRVVSPLAMGCRVPFDRRFIFAGLADRMSTFGHARRLWLHWGQPAWTTYAGGHVGFYWSGAVKRFVDDALSASFARAPRVPHAAA